MLSEQEHNPNIHEEKKERDLQGQEHWVWGHNQRLRENRKR